MTAADTSDNSPYNYVGRFAPSPSGPLHFGSLIAALASWLDARSNNGRWLLRIEDLDPPRESPTAPDLIKRQLETYGLIWDGTPLYQSTRQDAYDAALDELRAKNKVFACTCSRKSLTGVYAGTCREKGLKESSLGSFALRFRVPFKTIAFSDRISGLHQYDLAREIGDFIVQRRDSRTAYQLAVVVDDDFQGVTDIFRGDDLLDSTPRQQCLINALDYHPVSYAHLPVILGADKKKLSKQAHAAPVPMHNPGKLLRDALIYLGQSDAPDTNEVEALLDWGVKHWRSEKIPLRSTVWVE